LTVTLKGKASQNSSSSAGLYILGPNLINNKSHWLQSSGSNAIWYNKDIEIWAIGSQDYLGSVNSDILSTEEVYSPQEATTWEYFDGNKFIESVDILVDIADESGTLTMIA
jgi:hypothetical protein